MNWIGAGGTKSRRLWSRGLALLLLLPLAASVVHLILPHSPISTHCALCRLNHVPASPALARISLGRAVHSYFPAHPQKPDFFANLSRSPRPIRGPPGLLFFES